MRAYNAKPENNAKRRAQRKILNARLEAKSKAAERNHERYEGEYKAKQIERSRSRWRDATPEQRAQIAEQKREYQARPENKAKELVRSRLRLAEPDAKIKARAKHLKGKFGLSLSDYDAMLEAQDDRCAICRIEPTEEHLLSVDHNHACCPGKKSCGKCLRGLLCAYCNRYLLGHAKDSVEILERAIQYLLNPPLLPSVGQQLAFDFG